MPCSSRAAWYSAFSERSPSSRAALIAATIAGRRTSVSSLSSASASALPSGLIAFFTSSFTAPEGSGSDSGAGILREDIWGRFRFDVDLFASVLRVEDPGLAS